MNASNTVGILGCGWLGMALAKNLTLKKSYTVKGTTTSQKKIKKLKDLGVQPFQIELKSNSITGDFKSFIDGLDILIIAIPPKIRNTEYQFHDALEYLFSKYDFSKLSKLIYISSTGVFADGNQNVYTEKSITNNTSSRGKQLINLEKFILSIHQIKTVCILRYAGLIEENGRHPIHYLSGKTDIGNPDAPVNLIEREDAVDLLLKIIEAENNLSIYHGVNPSHPSRFNYYTEQATKYKLKPPKFDFSQQSIGKIISSEFTQKNLNFEYKRSI